MKMTKKVLAVVMAIAMLLCMAPITLAADGNVAKDKNGVEYATLADAVANGTSPITLLDDAEGTGIVIDRNITINFNGYTYTFTNPAVGSTGTKTLGFQILKNNSVTLKNGTLAVAEANANDYGMLIQNYADLTVNNMKLDGTNLKRNNYSYVLSINSGEVDIIGNTDIIASKDDTGYAFDVCKYASYATPFVTVKTTGTISGIVEVTGGDLEVEKGTFVSDSDCFYMTSGYIYLAEGVKATAGDCAVYLRGGELHTYADLTSTSTNYAAIQGNGLYAGDIYVHGGTITSVNDIGIYFPQNGFLCIYDGTITGTTAVYAKQGQIFVNGGTLKATGEAKDFVTNGNGGDATGDALVIETGHYGDLYAQVDGGTFVSENASAIASYAENENYTARTGFVNNAVIDGKFDASIFAENANVEILNPVVVNGVGYATVAEAVAAAADGAVIDLYADVTETKAITVAKDITINLNGNTWTLAKTGNYAVVVKGDLTINGDGTVIADTAYGFGTSTACTGGITINGGKYIGTEENIYLFAAYAGTIALVDGTFESDYCIANAFDGYTGEIIIKDGSYTITDYVTYPYASVVFGENVTVYGGTYSNAINYYNCADGFVCAENADGTYGVKAGTAVAIAQVADYTYVAFETLEAAVEAAIDGSTITLIADLTFTADGGSGAVNANWVDLTNKTLDLNGYTINTNRYNPLFTGDNFTITNGQFMTRGGASYSLFMGPASNVVVDGITSNAGINIDEAIENVTLRNCEFIGRNYYAVFVADAKNVVIESGTYKAEEGKPALYVYYATDTVVVKGGNWDEISQVEKYLADGYALVENADGTYDVTTAVAEINGVGYASLEAAAKAAKDGDTITLIADVTFATDGGAAAENATYIDLTNATLDLNGYTINANRYNPVFTGDNFTITNGKFMTKGADYGLFLLEATNVVIDGITSNAGINIQDVSANITIKNCDITGDDYYAIFLADVQNVVIESGSYIAKAGKKALYVYYSTDTVTVKGGTFSTDVAAYVAEGLETVKNADGTFGVQEVKPVSGFLTLKAQTNKAGTQLRFITTIDTLQYREVGFVITNAANTAQSTTKTSKTVYSSIVAGGKTYNAAQISGDADMNYILTYTITGIPASAQGMKYIVKPFVVTLDGQTIYGDAKTFCVADMLG